VEAIQTRRTDTGYESIVLLRRSGGSPEPVSVWLQFQDGHSMRKIWDGVQTHVQLKLESASPLLYAAIDPGNHIVLDNRKINNYLKAEVPPQQRTRYTAGIAQIIEGLFGALAW